ncbi:MAG: hypothetical protein KGS72_03215 [Cyanobacteria bacterium REEB67]|nr:hypothetical protein [Cyanobacteria bacterium REEB67]
MVQQGPISHAPQADRPEGSKPQDAHPSAGLDLLQVAGPERSGGAPTRQEPEPHSIGQFLNQVHHLAGNAHADGQSLSTNRENLSINIDHHSLNHELIFKSLEAKNPTFTTSEAKDGSGARTLSNIRGLALTMKVFGHDEQLAIKEMTISKGEGGKTTFALSLENPLPPETAKVFNTSNNFPLTFSTDARGRVDFPQDSEIFNSLAAQSGGTLPGMILSDAMKDAGSVALFIEKNPTWVNNILAPFAERFGVYVKSGFNASTVIDKPAQPPAIAHPGSPPQGKIALDHRTISGAVAAFKQPLDKQKPGDPPKPAAPPVDAPLPKIQKPGDYQQKMTILGRERTYSLHVPPSYDSTKPMPMVLMAHGMSQTGADLQAMIGSNKLADKEGFIAVYPDSVNWFNVKGLRTWESGNGLVLPGQHAGDVQFMGKLIDATKRQLNVDPMRVYMAGFSNGGMLAYATAGALSGTLASVAILSSTMSGKELRPKEPLSLINIHGTADPIIPIEGLKDTPAVLTDVGVPLFQPTHYGTDYYKALNGISAPYTVTKLGKEKIEYAANQKNGTAVEQITINGADHFLENRQFLLQQTWDFLKAHPRTLPPNPKDNVDFNQTTPLESMTAVRQLKDAIKKRGTTGIEQDVDNIFDAARTIKDFSFSPSGIYDKIGRSTYVNFTDPVSTFIQNTTMVSKKGDRITIDRKTEGNIPIGLDFGVGALKSMQVNKVTFDLDKQYGYPAMRNISGLTLHAQVAGYNMASRIEQITELPDGPSGKDGRIYEATMQNPLPEWMRAVLLSPNKFNVDMKFDADRHAMVVNQTMTERQLMGKNPFVNGIADEAQDTINLKDNFNFANTARLTSDVGITSGLTYLGLRLGGSRARLAATLCFLAAPVAIDFLRKELTT